MKMLKLPVIAASVTLSLTACFETPMGTNFSERKFPVVKILAARFRATTLRVTKIRTTRFPETKILAAKFPEQKIRAPRFRTTVFPALAT